MYECFLGLLKKKKKSRLARGKPCCMLTIKWHLVLAISVPIGSHIDLLGNEIGFNQLAF